LEDEVLARWAEFHEYALNHSATPPCQSPDDLASCARSEEGIELIPSTLFEVYAAIIRLKNGKAAISDGITAELLRHSVHCTGPALCGLFRKVWSNGMVPAQWKDCIIVPLYKGKSPKGECNSCRPITLLSVPGKVFAHVLMLLRHIEPLHTKKGGRISQDAVLALGLLSDLHRKFKRPLYVAYVDVKSAFDSVYHKALWKAVLGIGVPGPLVKAI